MIRPQPFVLPLNSSGVTVDMAVNFVFYASGNAGGVSNKIRIRPERGGADFILSPGDLVRLPEQSSRFTIANADNAGSIVGELVAGVGEFTTTRTIGQVEVIDGARARTLAGQAFMSAANATATAGNVPVVQLYNPFSNTRRVVVQSATLSSAAVGSLLLRLTGTASATLVGSAPSKRSGGVASSAELRTDVLTLAALPTTILGAFSLAAGTPYTVPLREPIVLLPGNGLVCASNNTAGIDLLATFDFTEEPI